MIAIDKLNLVLIILSFIAAKVYTPFLSLKYSDKKFNPAPDLIVK